MKGDLDCAIAEYSRAIGLNPNAANYYGARGDAYSAKGQLDRALADYDRVLAINPNDPLAQQRKRRTLAAQAELAKKLRSAADGYGRREAACGPAASGDTADHHRRAARRGRAAGTRAASRRADQAA